MPTFPTTFTYTSQPSSTRIAILANLRTTIDNLFEQPFLSPYDKERFNGYFFEQEKFTYLITGRDNKSLTVFLEALGNATNTEQVDAAVDKLDSDGDLYRTSCDDTEDEYSSDDEGSAPAPAAAPMPFAGGSTGEGGGSEPSNGPNP